MPFGSYQVSVEQAVANGTRFLKEAGCDCVKLEGGEEVCEAVRGLVRAGVLQSSAGKVQLLHWKDLPEDWNPADDERLPVWEATHHLIQRFNTQGEKGAGELLAQLPPDLSAEARQLLAGAGAQIDETNEVAAFEDLIGCHGGLGGYQAQPFVLYPAELSVPDEPLIGAAAVHHLMKGWVAHQSAE